MFLYQNPILTYRSCVFRQNDTSVLYEIKIQKNDYNEIILHLIEFGAYLMIICPLVI